jgi:integrase
LRLAPYVFVRPTELRAAEWSEMMLDSDKPEWRIPAERMKMREAHIVPLARQSVAVLRQLLPITGRQRYVFPAIGGGGRPLSENTINGAIRRLGYSGEEMTARISNYGEHVVERAGSAPRSYRVAACAC